MNDAKASGKSRSELRGIKKDNRSEVKDAKISNTIKNESNKAGIDFKNQINTPLSLQAKKRITDGVKRSTSQDFANDIESFSSTYSPPQLENLPQLEEQALKESVRKQRKARWADALYAFGQGLTGQTANPAAMRSKQLEAERKQQYYEYKDISERNKKVQQVWENQYRNDLMNWLDDKINDKNTADAEKEKYQKMADEIQLRNDELQLKRDEFDARKKGGYYQKTTPAEKPSTVHTEMQEDGSWQITNQKNPYSDLYYKLTANSPTVINEMAKLAGHTVEDDGSLKRNLSSDEIERFANTLLSRMFKVNTNEKGQRIAQPIPGMENYITDLSSKIDEVNTLKQELQTISDEQLIKVSEARNRNRDDLNEEYQQKIDAFDKQLKVAQNDLQSLLDGKKSETQTKLDNFFGNK